MGGSYFGVDLEVEGLDRLFDRLHSRAGDPTIMAIVSQDLVSAVSDRYDSEGNGEWAPHAASTLASRRGGGKGAKLMQNTGNAAGSTDANHGSTFAEATSSVDYLKYHLEGGSIIPKRNPFELDDDVFDDAADTILDWLVQ